MASAQVVETSVTNNSPSQDSYHPDDLFQSRYIYNIMGYRGKVRQIKTAAVTKLNVSNLHCCDLPFKITEHVRGCVAQNFIHGRVVLKKCLNPHIILKLMEP